eukprot:scaffold268225_cov19-Tisochrysis_lutea.AAC.1
MAGVFRLIAQSVAGSMSRMLVQSSCHHQHPHHLHRPSGFPRPAASVLLVYKRHSLDILQPDSGALQSVECHMRVGRCFRPTAAPSMPRLFHFKFKHFLGTGDLASALVHNCPRRNSKELPPQRASQGGEKIQLLSDSTGKKREDKRGKCCMQAKKLAKPILPDTWVTQICSAWGKLLQVVPAAENAFLMHAWLSACHASCPMQQRLPHAHTWAGVQ